MELAFLPRIYSSCLVGCRLFFRKEKGKKRQRRRDAGPAGKETQCDEEARRIKAAQHFSASWRKGRKKNELLRYVEMCVRLLCIAEVQDLRQLSLQWKSVVCGRPWRSLSLFRAVLSFSFSFLLRMLTNDG